MVIFQNTFVLFVIAAYLLACTILAIKAPHLLEPFHEDSRQKLLDFVKAQHAKRAEREELIAMLDDYCKSCSIKDEEIYFSQSSVEKVKMSKPMFEDDIRANWNKHSCGRKPRYKNHHNKAVRGMKQKYLYDACRF